MDPGKFLVLRAVEFLGSEEKPGTEYLGHDHQTRVGGTGGWPLGENCRRQQHGDQARAMIKKELPSPPGGPRTGRIRVWRSPGPGRIAHSLSRRAKSLAVVPG